jgi:hypothetical protein
MTLREYACDMAKKPLPRLPKKQVPEERRQRLDAEKIRNHLSEQRDDAFANTAERLGHQLPDLAGHPMWLPALRQTFDNHIGPLRTLTVNKVRKVVEQRYAESGSWMRYIRIEGMPSIDQLRSVAGVLVERRRDAKRDREQVREFDELHKPKVNDDG